jgi:enoyl-CoA hydratase
MIRAECLDQGVVELIIASPPVNALSIGDLAQLQQMLGEIGSSATTSTIVLRGEGRGFCGGGDVKEVQRLDGFEGILGQAAGSLGVSVAIAECPVPVIGVLHGYCIGVGVLIAGVCDILVAEKGTTLVMAEVDNGATGGAVQGLGLMPEKRLRAAMLTCEPVSMEELERYGSVYRLVAAGEGVAAARELADTIARKSDRVVRQAKASINLSIGRDVRAAYRRELSFTYELNLEGEASRQRQTFVDGMRSGYLSG